MLKTKLFAAAALTAIAGAAQAFPTSISFDGYCDGMTGWTQTSTTSSATWANLDCAGTSAVVGGPRGKSKSPLTGTNVNAYVMGSYGAYVYGTEFTWVIFKDYTWAVYSNSGGALLNYGTWSAGFPLAGGGGKSSIGMGK